MFACRFSEPQIDRTAWYVNEWYNYEIVRNKKENQPTKLKPKTVSISYVYVVSNNNV